MIATIGTIRATAIAALLLGCTTTQDCRADIYRLQGDDETLSFTDSPQDKRYRLVVREPRKVDGAGSGRKPPVIRQETVGNSSTADLIGTLPVQGRITSVTGLRSDPLDGRLRHHNGLDIAAPVGTPVKPVAPGTVIFSGWKSGYGNTVIVDHNDGMVTVYAHHADNNVIAGEPVNSNTVIALTGSTGRSTGPHLHFEAWRSGVNISRDFLPGSSPTKVLTAVAAPINRYLQPDGTIIFTNLR